MTAVDFGPFLQLGADARERLVAQGRTILVPVGEPLIREKSAASGAYVLTQGQLRVVSGDGRLIRKMVPPEIVGEIGAVTMGPRTATVIAEEPSTLLFIPIVALREAMADDPEFAKALREIVAERTTGLG